MHIIDKLKLITEAEDELHIEFGREPTIKELAEHLNMKPSTVGEILRGTQEPVSLSIPVPDSREETELGVLLHDETTPSPHDIVALKIDREVLAKTLGNLHPRSLEILEYRFGLNGKPELNLTDIGKIWGITYQRVKQIETSVLAKLQSDPNLQVLRNN
jgi:RNA polymerase primary sigma factor